MIEVEFLSSIVFNLVAKAKGCVLCLFAMASSAALDPVYGHACSVEFSLEYCTHDAQPLSINVYFLRVFYSNHTCPDVVFRF